MAKITKDEFELEIPDCEKGGNHQTLLETASFPASIRSPNVNYHSDNCPLCGMRVDVEVTKTEIRVSLV